ncbi:MAG: hypothetical protein HZC28_16100 [Spirochaetes bacterium]|nr:hypothetical protein [Spirochaetota bacterium]
MKKVSLLLLSLVLLTLAGCAKSAAIQSMRDRLVKFQRILPADIAVSFDIKAPANAAQYKAWQDAYYTWQKATLERERVNQSNAERSYYAINQEMYTISMLTNRFYERDIPVALMREVQTRSDAVAVKLDRALAASPELKKNLERVLKDEATVHFTTKDICFYFLWNYVITLERHRRFQ